MYFRFYLDFVSLLVFLIEAEVYCRLNLPTYISSSAKHSSVQYKSINHGLASTMQNLLGSDGCEFF